MTSNDDDYHGSWFMLLGWISLTLAVISIIPNIVIVIILTKNKIISDTLVNFRLSACADIMCAMLFLVLNCPSWLLDTNKTINSIPCNVEGVVSKWVGLALHYSLVYVMFQRCSQSKKEIAWKESKPCFLSPVLFIWVIFGGVVVLPFAISQAPYVYNPMLCQCVLRSRWMFLTYDVIHYVIPALFLFIAGTVLKWFQSKPFTKIRISGANSMHHQASPWTMTDPSSKKFNSGRYIRVEDISTQYTGPRHWKWKKAVEISPHLNITLLSSLESQIMGLETRLSFIYISYTSCIFIFSAFAFRMYGMWFGQTNNQALSASHAFVFVGSIVRSVIPLFVNISAKNYISNKRRLHHRMKQFKNCSLLVIPAQENVSLKRKLDETDVSKFVTFSLSMGNVGTHSNVGKQNMEEFWFRDINENVSSTNQPACITEDATVVAILLPKRNKKMALSSKCETFDTHKYRKHRNIMNKREDILFSANDPLKHVGCIPTVDDNSMCYQNEEVFNLLILHTAAVNQRGILHQEQ